MPVQAFVRTGRPGNTGRRAVTAIGLAVVVLVAQAAVVAAGPPEAKTVVRDYRVHGKTPRTLVGYMSRRPFRGDKGPALANIRPRYRMKAVTKTDRGRCRVAGLDLSIRFVMTLPRAVQRKAFDRPTRRAWSSFRSFARRHEEVHRRIYMGCARRFMRTARRLDDTSCFRLRAALRKRLRQQERDCDRLHDAFDRREMPRLRNQALFRAAKLRPARRRAGAAPRSPGFGLGNAFENQGQ